MSSTPIELDDLSRLIASKLSESEIGDKIKTQEITTEWERKEEKNCCILTENAL
jgi:hypothetical protein